MENLIVEATKFTPDIALLADARKISFKGKSYPENTFVFYAPTIAWLKEYFKSTKGETTVDFEITYFNSSSSKLFFDIFDIFGDAVKGGDKVVINWHYDAENESAEEAGEDFRDDFETLEFNLIKK